MPGNLFQIEETAYQLASYKRGPLRGIEYTSERQKRNAHEYYIQTGVVLVPAEAAIRARGLFGQKLRETKKERRLGIGIGFEKTILDYNHDYFLARTMQENTGRFIPITRAQFEKIWDAALRKKLQPSREFDRLLEAAGLRTGIDSGWNGRPRIHYQQYILQMWNELENVGHNRLYKMLLKFSESIETMEAAEPDELVIDPLATLEATLEEETEW